MGAVFEVSRVMAILYRLRELRKRFLWKVVEAWGQTVRDSLWHIVHTMTTKQNESQVLEFNLAWLTNIARPRFGPRRVSSFV